MLKALLVTIVYWFVSTQNVRFYGNRACGALVVSTLTGLVLGDVTTGVIMGGFLQTVFMGVIDIGGSIPTDENVASVISTALVIQTGCDYATGVALAYVVGTISGQIWQMWYPALSVFDAYFDRVIEKGDMKQFAFMHMFFGTTIQLLPKYIIIFAALSVGTDAFQAFIDSIPPQLMTGLSAAGNMVVGVGIAMIVNLIWKPEIGGFFFFGFLLASAMGLSTIQVALIAAAFAIFYYSLIKDKKDNDNVVAAIPNNDGGDFFE